MAIRRVTCVTIDKRISTNRPYPIGVGPRRVCMCTQRVGGLYKPEIVQHTISRLPLLHLYADEMHCGLLGVGIGYTEEMQCMQMMADVCFADCMSCTVNRKLVEVKSSMGGADVNKVTWYSTRVCWVSKQYGDLFPLSATSLADCMAADFRYDACMRMRAHLVWPEMQLCVERCRSCWPILFPVWIISLLRAER